MTISSPLIHKHNVWLFGLSGILGGLTLFVGDMLFYFNGEQTDLMINMAQSSHARIMASGVTALFAAWFYTLGAGQIFYAFEPAKAWVRNTVFLSFAAIMITYGVVHAAYVAIATSAHNASALGLKPNELAELSHSVNNLLRLIAYVPVGIFSILFITSVWKKQTHFPRWIIVFCPVIPFAFAGPIANALDGQWKTIIAGGYLNLILVVFFSATSFALRK